MFVWEASYTPGELNNKLMSVISAQRFTLLAAPCPRQSEGSLAHQANAPPPPKTGRVGPCLAAKPDETRYSVNMPQ